MSTLFDQQVEDDLCDMLRPVVGYAVFYMTDGVLNGYFFSSTGHVSNDIEDCVVFRGQASFASSASRMKAGRREVACVTVYGLSLIHI